MKGHLDADIDFYLNVVEISTGVNNYKVVERR